VIFFTADQHFGHANIIEYCTRPFATVEDMDAEMVRRWNEKVGPSDKVYHLGDFTLGSDARKYFKLLNGRVVITGVAGHHDHRWIDIVLPKVDREGTTDMLSASGWRVRIASPMVVLQTRVYKMGEYPQIIVLCHYPFARWDRCHYGSWHLHGHCHGRYRADGLICDVGVDNNDFYPVSLQEVAEIMREKDDVER